MPELDKSNLEAAVRTKFVRKDSSIYFSKDHAQDHEGIKEEFVPGESVDDAGILDLGVNGKLVAVSGSSTLGISDFDDGRIETDEILHYIQAPTR